MLAMPAVISQEVVTIPRVKYQPFKHRVVLPLLRSDECSVFGIAAKPPYSRCYNSSQSLWMRRAYNGVLYNRGRQLPAAQSMSKIHPGDVVRCEVDMDEGTVRFRFVCSVVARGDCRRTSCTVVVQCRALRRSRRRC